MAAVVSLDAGARQKKIAELLAAGNVAELSAVCEAAADESVLVSNGRPVLTQVLDYASDKFEEPLSLPLCEAFIGIIQKRQSRYGEEVIRVRELLADHYECNDRQTDALKVLQGIPMDAGLRSAEDTYKVSVWVRISEIAMQTGDEVAADSYITKAWPLLKNVTDAALRLRFLTIFAEVNDFKRKFTDAAYRFYDLSHQDIDDHVPALRKATVCVFLAEVGPRRSRLLQTLYQDERIEQIGDLKTVLAKIYHNRILRPHDVELLKPHLLTHHQAITANKRKVYENAVMQHNLLSASKLYYNISFGELGALLAVSPEEAEKVCAKMVAEDRIVATIDQVEETIVFASDVSAPIHQWDTQISAACNGVATIADNITQAHPQFAKLLSA